MEDLVHVAEPPVEHSRVPEGDEPHTQAAQGGGDRWRDAQAVLEEVEEGGGELDEAGEDDGDDAANHAEEEVEGELWRRDEGRVEVADLGWDVRVGGDGSLGFLGVFLGIGRKRMRLPKS